MAEVIRMPRLSDTMTEGNIISWLKKVGDPIKPGDVLAEVETDKANMDLESFQEGTLLYIGVEKGTIKVNDILAILGKPGEDYSALLQAEATPSAAASPNVNPTAPTQVASAPASAPTSPGTISTSSSPQRVHASPLAKKMAEQAGVSLQQIQGSGGDNHRIVKKDVEAFLKSGKSALSTNYISQADSLVPVSQMRKTIARRLSESMFTAPHFYLTMEFQMERCMQVRESYQAATGEKISFNDMVIKACAMALRKHPNVNSSWLGDQIRRNGSINIGVAVAVDEGLVVPVIRNADMKSLNQLNTEVKQFATKAKEKKIQPTDMEGNTFTISNLGMFGIEEFTAIINPPDACILAVGTIVEKPIVRNQQIVIGHTMKCTLSCDHRIVDGVSGAKFLQTVQAYLEEPALMFMV